MAKNILPYNLRPGYKKTEKEKDIQENGFNGTKDRASSRKKSSMLSSMGSAMQNASGRARTAANQAQERGKTRTTREKVKQLYNSPFGQSVQKVYNDVTSGKKTSSESKSSTTEKKKKDPNRFKAISEKANASRTDEQNAAIKKNNDRIYWKNKERANNSGSYKAMMQSRTKGEMQRASKRYLSEGKTDNYNTASSSAKNKAYDKAFGKKKGR